MTSQVAVANHSGIAVASDTVTTTFYDGGAKTVGEGDLQIQVLGKIDLDKINSKTRPDKKKKPEKKEKEKLPGTDPEAK